MRSVFLLGYPQTPTRALPRELWRGRGAETYTQQKIIRYIKSWVYRSQTPLATPSLGSEGILKRTLISFLKSRLLKTPDLIITLSYVVYRSQPPFPPPKLPWLRPCSGLECILKGKLTSFLKSLLLGTPELIYFIVFCCV